MVHYAFAIFCIWYFTRVNTDHPNQSIKGIELSVRDHVLAVTEIQTNCVSDHNVYCNPNGTGYSVRLDSVEVYTPNIKTIQWMLISFFLITGSFHLYYYIGNQKLNGHYTYMIQNRNNYFRWIEYSITSTLMLYIIALISNVKEKNVYLLIYATNIVMIAMGQMVEVAVRDGKDWITPMICGFILLFSEFSIVLRSYWNRLHEVNKFSNQSSLPNKPSLPKWTQSMIILLFLFYSSFGFLSLFSAYTNISYEIVEKIYIWLSLFSKTTLGIYIIYANSQLQTKGWAGTF